MRQYSTDLPDLADGSSGGRACIDRARKPVAIVVQKQSKCIVGGDSRKRQGFIAAQRTDIAALVQHDTVPCGDRNGNLIVPSEIAIQTDRLQIIIDDREQPCLVHLELELLAKLSAQCRAFVLSIVDAATEQAPVAGVPNIRNVIAQLHDVATILEHEQRCDGVAGLQRGARCQKVCSGQEQGLCCGWDRRRALAIYMQNRLSLWSGPL